MLCSTNKCLAIVTQCASAVSRVKGKGGYSSRRTSIVAGIFAALALFWLLSLGGQRPVAAQTPTSTPTSTPTVTPTPIIGYVAPFSAQNLPVPDPADITGGFLFRTSGTIRQRDSMAYLCPSQYDVKGKSTVGFVADEWEEASAYTVVMCRAKGVVDYMVLAGSGLLFFGLVWTALLHIVGSAQDPQRQSQESMASVFRILVGYTILIMCYLVSSVFFHSSITPFLPY